MLLACANPDSGESKQKETKATKGSEASYIQSHIDLGRNACEYLCLKNCVMHPQGFK